MKRWAALREKIAQGKQIVNLPGHVCTVTGPLQLFSVLMSTLRQLRYNNVLHAHWGELVEPKGAKWSWFIIYLFELSALRHILCHKSYTVTHPIYSQVWHFSIHMAFVE